MLPAVLEDGVQRGEHDVLAGLRGAEEGDQQDGGGGESAASLRGLYLHPVPQGGETGMSSTLLSPCQKSDIIKPALCTLFH